MRFTKMHGCGNDYVVVEALAGEPLERFGDASVDSVCQLAAAVNDRRFGVGADGFVLVLPETRDGSPADAEMRMYNPDGSYSAMCGNALRCVAKHAYESGALRRETTLIRTGDTVVPMRIVEVSQDGLVERVEVDLGPPRLAPNEVPCLLPAGEEGDLRNAEVVLGDRRYLATILSMGNPHCVYFAEDLRGEAIDDRLVTSLGPDTETHRAFPERTNVEFVEVLSRSRLRQRTWERGAGETLACGSGAGAVGVAGVLTGRTERRVTIELLGGDLDIEWRASDDHVLKTGPAVEVYRGEWPDRAS